MERERPELALVDLMLPDTDGIELMQAILEVADVPVIFLSVYGRRWSPGLSNWGPSIMWSSPSCPQSWGRGSGQPGAGGCPLSQRNPTCWAI